MCAVREYNTDPVGQVTMRKDHGLKHIQVNVRAYDPTRTTVLRNRFAKASDRKFNELIRLIKLAVGTNDVLELQPKITTFAIDATQKGAFAFLTDPQKVEEFLRWVKEQSEKGILSVEQFGERWTDAFITEGYKTGVARARLEIILAGGKVPTIDQTGGINFAISDARHADRLAMMFTRVWEELQGVNATMAQHISRILTQGLIEGENPIPLARKLVAAINGANAGELGVTDTLGRFIPAKRRAEIITRTEIIRSHHLAAIEEYRRWGIQGVQVKAEFSTSHDAKVCPICLGIEAEGKLYTLDEIEGMIPVHPQCRCIALPRVVNAKEPVL